MDLSDHKDEDNDNFLRKHNILGLEHTERAIVSVYFAFTSLSTVGFGDFVPRSDNERVMGSAMLLFGVAIFSYCMGKFVEIFNEIIVFNEDLDDGDNLHKFFGVLQRFNNNKPIDINLKRKIEEHFNHMWINNKNAAISCDKDVEIFN